MNYHLFIILSFFLCSFNLSGQDELNPCLQGQDFHIIILGSSTAAGSGPSSPDSTWVNRYRKHLQSINPNNEVTNLALGGTTTYHIMPDWFVPPPGRPATNPDRNVSQAIALGADAIIVNMPSNDASNNFGIAEQMSNFLTISAEADSFDIPIWVCTTQPKTAFGASQDAIQLGVRDSILSSFGDRAIDFWTTIALPSNDIDPVYDSGDGTHLNNAAHGILFERVKAKQILSNIFESPETQDYAIISYTLLNPNNCGDSATLVQIVLTNLGTSGVEDIFIQHHIYNSNLLQTEIIYDTLAGGLAPCVTDTLFYSIQNSEANHYALFSFLEEANDTLFQNDTSAILQYQSIGNPVLSPHNDTICKNESAILSVDYNSMDTVFWYENISDSLPIEGGPILLTPPLLSSKTYFAEAVRGDLFFKNNLFTTGISNKNWNGVMINFIANDSIIIDSLKIKIADISEQGLIAFYKNGSYENFENSPASWSLWGIDTANVLTPGSFHTYDFGTLSVNSGDTLGIYLHLENPAARLAYNDANDWISRATDELEILSGSGISYTFGDIYFPRDWNGEVFYHFGDNPTGNCSTGRQAVQAILSLPEIELGNDTMIYSNETILLDAGADFEYIYWNGTPGNRFYNIDSTNFELGTHEIILEIENKFGCLAIDTILITIELLSVGIKNKMTFNQNFLIHPNPTQSYLWIQNLTTKESSIRLLDIFGKTMLEKPIQKQTRINMTKYSKGIYFLEIKNKDGKGIRKIILE